MNGAIVFSVLQPAFSLGLTYPGLLVESKVYLYLGLES